MPLQRVVERDALTDEALAMVDEQPQIEFGPVQLRGRQGVEAFAQRRTCDRDRVDAVGLPPPAGAPPRVGHQLRRHPQHALAAFDQKPLEGARDMPAILQGPDPFAAEPTCPDHQRGEALGADLDGLLANQFAGCR
jgi:hypothetical protein